MAKTVVLTLLNFCAFHRPCELAVCELTSAVHFQHSPNSLHVTGESNLRKVKPTGWVLETDALVGPIIA